ncbi:MAG: prenyltransferase/squalene oxidase repeat-containing protein [Candidatus Thermoplasmatota archaeon]
MEKALVAVMALALVLASTSVEAKGDALPAARDAALEFLARQGGDGAYPAGLAPYAVEAAVAAGLDAASWPSRERSALAGVLVPAMGEPLLRLVRPAHAIALAGGDLTDWNGDDLETRLRAGFDGAQFGDAVLLNDDAYALLALRATGAPSDDAMVESSARFLADHQNADGGWGYAAGSSSGTDTTGMVLAALASGVETGATAWASDGRAFVNTTRAGAGYAEMPGGTANCDSTVWALRTLGDHGDAQAWEFLLGLQQADGGVAYQPGQPSNALCTAEAAALFADAAAGRIPAPGFGSDRGVPASSAILASALLVGLAAATRFRRN